MSDSKGLDATAVIVSVVALCASLKSCYDSSATEKLVNQNFHSIMLSEIQNNNNKILVFTSQNNGIFTRNANGVLDCTRKDNITDSDAKSMSMTFTGLTDLNKNFDISQLGLISVNEMPLLNDYQKNFDNLQKLFSSSEKITDENNRKDFREVLFSNFCNFANSSQKAFESFSKN